MTKTEYQLTKYTTWWRKEGFGWKDILDNKEFLWKHYDFIFGEGRDTDLQDCIVEQLWSIMEEDK